MIDLVKVCEITKKTGVFSLSYDLANDEWDASFFSATNESGCAYAPTAMEAIEKALAIVNKLTGKKLSERVKQIQDQDNDRRSRAMMDLGKSLVALTKQNVRLQAEQDLATPAPQPSNREHTEATS